MRVFLRFQCLQTGIGVLEGCVHLVWCESVRFNLCHHEVFRHCEQGLGHRAFLDRGGGAEQQGGYVQASSSATSSAFLFSNCASFLCRLRISVCTLPSSVFAFLCF